MSVFPPCSIGLKERSSTSSQKHRKMTKSTCRVALVFLFLGFLMGVSQAQIQVTRIELQAPWTGMLYNGGNQIWGKAVVHNASRSTFRKGYATFDFLEGSARRQSLRVWIPDLRPGGTVVIESGSWWDAEGTSDTLICTVYSRTGKFITERALDY
jgi:hypothetical protein